MTEHLSRRDVDFMLYEWLDVEAVTRRPRFAEHSRDTFDAVLDLSEDMATKLFATHNKKSDSTEPRIGPDGRVVLIDEIGEALTAFGAAGLIAGTFPEDLGGMSLPNSVARASTTFFQAANAATTSYAFLTVGNANLIVRYGTPEQIDTWVRPMLEGRWFGTMCLSEPQAGSSLADITTRAVPAPDGSAYPGSHRISGTKMWISGGDHEITDNIVHLVLAKTPGGGPGVKGISLFVVPKVLPDGTRNDVALVGLNHKMGNRGTTNTLLNFGDGTHAPDPAHAGAVGYLIGEEHRGLHYMFSMMNEARVGVGFLATALGHAGYRTSLEYAKVRTQGRPVDAKDPAAPPIPIIEHPDVKRMMLAQKAYAEGALALCLYCACLLDDELTLDEAAADHAHLLLEVLTPIAKSWPSQWCLEANSLAIQVHGGYGYTTEFDVEQFYRDNRLNPIHEGAHGIHGLDLLGRKVIMGGGRGLRVLVDAVTATVDEATERGGEPAAHAAKLSTAIDRLAQVTAALWAPGDPAVALANATAYLEAAGHIVVAWMWLQQVLAADAATGHRDGDEAFYEGKRAAARYFFAYELPKTAPQLDLLASLDRITLDTRTEWL